MFQYGKKGPIKQYNPQKKDSRRIWLLLNKQLPRNFKKLKNKGGSVSVITVHYFAPSDKECKVGLPKFFTKKPDNDNMEKFYFDILKNLIMFDDCQIWHNTTIKRYTLSNPKTIFRIRINYYE